MRCAEIQIHARIPIPTNSDGNGAYSVPCFRDGNNVTYQIEAIMNACDTVDNLPIIRYTSDGSSEVIGVARSIKWDYGFIEIDGTLWCGGTSEKIIFDNSSKAVVSMSIESIGLGIT